MVPKNILKDNKGVILVMVLAVVLVIVTLANIVVAFISSQTRLTSHQMARIQAYYAARAGMFLAIDKLREGDWNPNLPLDYCINCTAGAPPPRRYSDPNIPYAVIIELTPAGNPGCNIPPAPPGGACIVSRVDYSMP